MNAARCVHLHVSCNVCVVTSGRFLHCFVLMGFADIDIYIHNLVVASPYSFLTALTRTPEPVSCLLQLHLFGYWFLKVNGTLELFIASVFFRVANVMGNYPEIWNVPPYICHFVPYPRLLMGCANIAIEYLDAIRTTVRCLMCRVSQEERSIFWEVMESAILSIKVQYIARCTDEQHAKSSHELQSALMLRVEFSKIVPNLSLEP
jgi:hypothetical protein